MPDPADPKLDAAFVTLLSQHEPAIRAFLRALLGHAADVDTVMPEVALVAWRKFSELGDHGAFPRWACVIARYEVLKFRRHKARDRLILDEDVVLRLADQADASLPRRERQLRALEKCLRRIPEHSRGLLLSCYAPDTTIREVARRTRRTEDSLYQWVHRVRLGLHACVTAALEKEEPA